MKLLCRIGLHRWKPCFSYKKNWWIGYMGVFGKDDHWMPNGDKCQHCGKGSGHERDEVEARK